MTEEVKATTETETETTAKTETEKVYRQADVDHITEKVRQTEEAKRVKAEKALADLQARNMTEDEKKLAAAKAEGRKEVETQLEAAKREAAVLRHLAAKLGPNASDEQLADLAKLTGDGDPKEAVEALAAKWPGIFSPNTTRAPGGGGGRNQAPQPSEPFGFDADGVNQAKAALSASEYVTWYNKNREAIAAGNGLTIRKHPGIPGAMTPAGGARS